MVFVFSHALMRVSQVDILTWSKVWSRAKTLLTARELMHGKLKEKPMTVTPVGKGTAETEGTFMAEIAFGNLRSAVEPGVRRAHSERKEISDVASLWKT